MVKISGPMTSVKGRIVGERGTFLHHKAKPQSQTPPPPHFHVPRGAEAMVRQKADGVRKDICNQPPVYTWRWK